MSGQNKMYTSPLSSFLRLSLYLLWVGVIIPVQGISLLLRLPYAKRFPQIAHRVCARIIGGKVETLGRQDTRGSMLFVINHSSYLDISYIGSTIAGSFVAKSEVASWPIFGLCAKLARTVFIERDPRKVASQSEHLKARLKSGDRLLLFPEGTSSDGNRVLPFRSALFSAAEIRIDDKPVPVQPVSIAYTHLDGIPMGRHLRPFFAWYGDMDLAPHLWQSLGLGRARVVIEFHDTVTVDEFGSRKELAAYCQAVIAAGVSKALTGREQPVLFPGVTKKPQSIDKATEKSGSALKMGHNAPA
jgi:1-acyl-sn-glycerol-3-phosphate acyltransferase